MNPRIFTETQAKYFCSNFNSSTGSSQNSIERFQKNVIGEKSTKIIENSPLFTQYKDCLLRETERLLFLAISHYRRSLDLMIASASPWLQVTLYYGTWFSAKALLSMFGCYISQKVVIDVDKGDPSKQVFQLRQIGNGKGKITSTYYGQSNHRRFWDFFYKAVSPLRTIVDPRLAPSLGPINNNPIWLIKERNRINYNSSESIEHILNFQKSFSSKNFPSSLSGVLATQYRSFELLLELSINYSRFFNLHTDALNRMLQNQNFSETVEQLIYNEKAPNLDNKTIKNFILSP